MNPMKTMHGGILTTLLDCVLGSAVLSTLPAGRGHHPNARDEIHTRG